VGRISIKKKISSCEEIFRFYSQAVSSTQIMVWAHKLVMVKAKLTGPATKVSDVVIPAGLQIADDSMEGAKPQQEAVPVSKVKQADCPKTLQNSSKVTPFCKKEYLN